MPGLTTAQVSHLSFSARVSLLAPAIVQGGIIVTDHTQVNALTAVNV